MGVQPDAIDEMLAAQLVQAQRMTELCDNAGEADAHSMWSGTVRAIELEQRNRARQTSG